MSTPHILFTCDESALEERKYLLRWLFQDVYGFDLSCVKSHESGIQTIRFANLAGELRLPDIFFPAAHKAWLSQSTLPREPIVFLQNGLPVLFGAERSENCTKQPCQSMEVDIPGTLFFLMSRYEEAVSVSTDGHGRFPSRSSILSGSGLIQRAIGNEYIEYLWDHMIKLWPGIAASRRKRFFKTIPSHDIDFPSGMWSNSRDLISGVSGHVVKGRLGTAASIVKRRFTYNRVCRERDWESDPYDTVSWIIQTSETEGLKSTFFYIPERTSHLDPGMPLNHPHVIDQWKRIAAGGHEIGCHPGYDTFVNPDRIKRAADRLTSELSRQKISQDRLGTRQHFLRWKTTITDVACDAAGFDYDSTLAYADSSGFRCGICYEFPMYDLKGRRQLNLIQRPLIVMDCSVVDNRYMGLGKGEAAFEFIRSLKDTCRRFDGDFTILWHNQRFADANERRLYQNILEA